MGIKDEAAGKAAEGIAKAAGAAITRRGALEAAAAAVAGVALHKADAVAPATRFFRDGAANIERMAAVMAAAANDNGFHGWVGAGHYAWGGYAEGGILQHMWGIDQGIGCATGWAEWECGYYHGSQSQWLRWAFALELTSDYSNELYSRFNFKTYTNCGDINGRTSGNTVGHRLWYNTAADGGDINFQYWSEYLSPNPLSFYGADLRNDIYCPSGVNKRWNWYDSGFHSMGLNSPTAFTKRQKGAHGSAIGLTCQVDNVYSFGGRWHPRGDFYSSLGTGQHAGGDLRFSVPAITIKNRWDLFGKVVSITPKHFPGNTLYTDAQIGQQGIGLHYTAPANGSSHTFIVNAGIIDDTSGGILHVFSSLAGEGNASLCLNEWYGNKPSTDAIRTLWLHPYTFGDRASMFWCHAGGTGNNGISAGEPGYSYLICDGTGRALDVQGGSLANSAAMYHCGSVGTSYANETMNNEMEKFVIDEVRLWGTLSVPDDVTAGRVLKPSDWNQTCRPVNDGNGHSLVPLYRWYAADADADEDPMDSDSAVITAEYANEWGLYGPTNGPMKRIPAYQYINFPALGAPDGVNRYNLPLHDVNLKLEGSRWSGSVRYRLKVQGGAWTAETADGAWTGSKGAVDGMEVWLEGEIAEHYDVDLRCFAQGRGWQSVHSFSSSVAHAVSSGAGTIMSAQVSLVRKPKGAKLAREFSSDAGFKPLNEQVGKRLYVGMIISMPNQPRNEIWSLTDRMQGDVVSAVSGIVKPIPVHFMVVDENGDPVEIHTGTIKVDGSLKGGDGNFQEAERKFKVKWPGKVWDHTLKWFQGDMDGPATPEKSFEDIDKVETETWVWAMLQVGRVRFYANSDPVPVYTVDNVIAGTMYTLPSDVATEKANAASPFCNLNAAYGTEASTGFLGWFSDAALTELAPAEFEMEARTYDIFGRSRLTARFAYAAGSATSDPAADYRVAPREDADAYEGAMALPDFTGREPAHRLPAPVSASTDGTRAAAADDVDLPAIGDDGPAHRALYKGESFRLTDPATVFRYMGSHRWRSYRFEGWYTDEAATAPAAAAQVPTRDQTLYAKWVESTVDGVVTTRE